MSARGRPRLALPYGEVEFEPDEVALLRDAAAALAGQSPLARDLSLLLDRSLNQPGPVALRRPELKLLVQLTSASELHAILELLADVA